MPKFLKLKDKDIAGNKIHRWLSFFDNNISEETLKELIGMDIAIQTAQKKIEYISNDAESYRQILLREQALLDYQSDLNAYKREGRQEIINAMKKSGMSNEAIEKILKLSE